MADDQRRAQSPDTGRNIIRLNSRHEYPQRARPAPRKAPVRAISDEDLRAVLDRFLVAQIELCGVDHHPTRASLTEMRFRLAREALAEGIAQLQKLAAAARSAPAIGSALPDPRADDVHAAD